MATLDYALLAEFARVDAAGLLTVVGASFDRLQAPGPGTGQQMAVVLRVLLDEDEPAADFQVNIEPPNFQFTISFTGTAERNDLAVPVDGHIAVSLALDVTVPLLAAGRYVVSVSLGETVVKRLPFVVEFPPAPGT